MNYIPNWVQALVSVSGVSLLSLIGVLTLKLDEDTLQGLIPGVLALAVGALLGDAFLHLLPDANRQIQNPTTVGLLVLTGTLTFFALDQALHNRPANAQHTTTPLQVQTGEPKILPIGPMSIAANSIHNMVDGVLIGGSFLVSSSTGVATLIAVALHEIPHEAANFGVLLHANYGRKRAILVNFVVGLAATGGTVLALVVGIQRKAFTAALLPFTAGCFVYMACADLIPSLLSERVARRPVTAILLIASGIALMLGLLFLER